MTYNVLQKHLDAGKPVSAKEDPVALAIGEVTGSVVLSAFDRIIIFEKGMKSYAVHRTPDVVVDKMTEFDKGKKVEPFSFELDL